MQGQRVPLKDWVTNKKFLLKPNDQSVTTYIKDSWGIFKFLPRKINYDYYIYSSDIESLYTLLPTELVWKLLVSGEV